MNTNKRGAAAILLSLSALALAGCSSPSPEPVATPAAAAPDLGAWWAERGSADYCAGYADGGPDWATRAYGMAVRAGTLPDGHLGAFVAMLDEECAA